jgi:hypothetical protein
MSLHPWNLQHIQSFERSPIALPLQHKLVIIRGVDARPEVGGGAALYGRPQDIRRYQNTSIYQSLNSIRVPFTTSLYWASLEENAHTVINNVLRDTFPLESDTGPTRAFHPGTRVVLYGYSAGAYNVLQVCRSLENYRYNFGSGRFIDSPTWLPPTEAQPQVVVDLLVTVDAVKNQLSGRVQQSPFWRADVAKCVRWCVNYYQTDDDPRSHDGGRGPRLEGQRGRVFNVRISNTNHHDINDVAARFAGRNVESVLSGGTPVIVADFDARDPHQSAPR